MRIARILEQTENEMKTLVLIRHAKSSWDSKAETDFDRPLSDRGRKDAPRIAAFLAGKDLEPNQIVTSPAARALTTARMIAEGIGLGEDRILEDRRIYLADLHHLQSIMREFSEDWECVYVVGHNPTFTEAANALAADDIDNLPTCGVYAVRLRIDQWVKLRNGVGERLFFQRPKEL